MFLKKKLHNSRDVVNNIVDNTWGRVVVFFAMVFILTLCFYNNFFKSVKDDWFKFHQIDSESFVVGRLAESKKNGLSSNNYNLGYYAGGETFRDILAAGTWIDSVEYQNDIYNGKKEYDNDYRVYISQVGAQGFLFGVINKIFGDSLSIDNFHFLNSFLTSIVLIYFLALVYFEFGLFPALVFSIGIFFSDWITVFGRNIYWVIWSMFLPLVINFHYLYKKYNKKEPVSFVLCLLSLFVILVFKFLSGFEYTSTILIAMMVPLFYYAVKYKIGFKEFIKLFAILSLVGIAAFIFAFAVWTLQLYVFTGDNVSEVFRIVQSNILKRTHNISDLDLEPILYQSTVIPWYRVIFTYLGSEFWVSVALFFLCAIFVIKKRLKDFYPILIATFVALLAPLSWFVLGKGHSYIHKHINFLLWYIPFIPFLWILGAQVVGALFYHGNLRLYFRRNIKKYIALIILIIIMVVAVLVSRREINMVLNSNLLSSYKNYYIYESNNKFYYVIRDCEPYHKVNKFFIKFYDGEAEKVMLKEFYFSELRNLRSIYPRYYDFCVAEIDFPEIKVDKFETGQVNMEKKFEGWELEVNLKKLD